MCWKLSVFWSRQRQISIIYPFTFLSPLASWRMRPMPSISWNIHTVLLCNINRCRWSGLKNIKHRWIPYICLITTKHYKARTVSVCVDHSWDVLAFIMTSSDGDIFRVTGLSLGESTGQWGGALMFPLICAWTNSRENNRHDANLRRHRAHYDVTNVILLFIQRNLM